MVKQGMMNKFVGVVNVGALLFCAASGLLTFVCPVAGDNSDPVAQADHAFCKAFEKKDATALKEILDAQFIDSQGRRLNGPDLLEHIPTLANPDAETQIRGYGDAAAVRANRGRMNVLRIWVKRPNGWRAMLYQEVLQAEKSQPAGGKPSTACVNPCKAIPYQPQTQAEKEVIASWQGVMKAMEDNDADAYSPLIADESPPRTRIMTSRSPRAMALTNRQTEIARHTLLAAGVAFRRNVRIWRHRNDGRQRTAPRSQILFQHAHVGKTRRALADAVQFQYPD